MVAVEIEPDQRSHRLEEVSFTLGNCLHNVFMRYHGGKQTCGRNKLMFVIFINDNDSFIVFSSSPYRLLDICHGQRHQREMSLYLVFEHVHQDLATYLENCPSPGLGQDRIKVRTNVKSIVTCKHLDCIIG